METSLKTGFAKIFSCCPKNLSCPKFWGEGGCSPPRLPPARMPLYVVVFRWSSKSLATDELFSTRGEI